ncbi:15058_t:CDS:1 [Racocetra persica]|uniref:15058_t:CDS:1 n=1 Tax=Racocetra persica TaxID=160502 RepID=A0ACA9KMB4_9GLOM|nr:15058_t:CDS:1 [Racocetra persica]
MLSIGKNNIRGKLSSLRYWTNLKRLDLKGINVFGLEYISHNPFDGVNGVAGMLDQDYVPTNIEQFNNNTWRGPRNDFRKLSDSEVCKTINSLCQQLKKQDQELEKLKLQNQKLEEKLKLQNQELATLKLQNQESEEKLNRQNQNLEKQQNQELEMLKQQNQEKLKQQNQELEKLKQQNQENLKQQNQQLEKLKQQNQELEKLKQQLEAFSNLLSPSQSYNFTQIKQEITRLKWQELAPQVRKKDEQLKQLVIDAKAKTDNLGNIIDLLLETQRQITKTRPESNEYFQTKGQLNAFQNVLENNFTKEELHNLLNKQIELVQLENLLASLQINNS